MVELTAEQCDVVEKAKDQPVRLRHPETRTEYVVMPAKVFERMRRLLETEIIDPSFFEFEEPVK